MAKNQTSAAATKVADKTPAEKGQTKPAAKGKGKNAAAPEVPKQTGPGGAPLVEAGAKHDVTPEQRQGERRQQQENAIAQFTSSQLSAPAAHAPELSEEQKKAAEFQAEMAKLAEKYGQPLPTAPVNKPARANAKEQRNGITRPALETLCGTIWNVADEISRLQNGAPAQIAQVKQDKRLLQVNDHTIKTQYSRWRQYNGIKGRLQVIQQPKEAGHYPEAEPNLVKPAAPQAPATA